MKPHIKRQVQAGMVTIRKHGAAGALDEAQRDASPAQPEWAQLSEQSGLANARSFAWGECINLGSKRQLAELLRHQGLLVDERNFSIAIQSCECFKMEFGSATENQASVEGTAAQLPTMIKDAELVAAALTKAGVVFWIEVTDNAQQPLRYLHNQFSDL